MITHTTMTHLVVEQHRVELHRRAHRARLTRHAVHAVSTRRRVADAPPVHALPAT